MIIILITDFIKFQGEGSNIDFQFLGISCFDFQIYQSSFEFFYNRILKPFMFIGSVI